MTRVFRHHPLLVIGSLLTFAMVSIAVVSLFWTPLPPTQINILQRLKPPLDQELLGTDQFGRDMASMLMTGAWNSLSTAVLAVAGGAMIGTALGLLVAVSRGLFETVVMRTCDVIFSVPPILSAMVLAAFLGAGRFTAVIAIGSFMIPVFVRISLAAALQIWTRAYVLAAIAMGRSKLKITLVHVLPNISNQLIVQVTIQLGLAILTEAGLSFLGLGLAPPAATWGRMLAEAQTFIAQAPWLALLPGLAISVTVVGLSLLGDGLRDLLDPRSR
jgi:peptide/nickel transport system permease protein